MHNYCIFMQMCSILTESDSGVPKGALPVRDNGNNASGS